MIRKATIGLFLASTVSAGQLFDQEEMEMVEMHDLYDEVATDLLTIHVTEGDKTKIKAGMKKLEITIKTYQWDEAIMKKAQADIEALLKSDEGHELGDWLKKHTGPRAIIDIKTKILMKKTKTQYQIMLNTWMELQQHMYAKHKGDGLHIDNDAWQKFEAEYAKFIKYRKELIHSPLGDALKDKIDALRDLPAFKDLKKQWFAQCHTKSGEAFKTAFDNFLAIIAKNVPLEDKPEGFDQSVFAQEFFKLVGMFDETIDGHPTHFLDWLMDELE